MIPSRHSFVLVILLTLLQCFAPLLHAHAFELGRNAGVHLHDSPGLHSAGPNTLAAHVLHTPGDESPAIGMAQEYRQDSAMALSDAAQLALVQFPQISSCYGQSLPVSHGASPLGGCCSHFIPFSQAPPALLL